MTLYCEMMAHKYANAGLNYCCHLWSKDEREFLALIVARESDNHTITFFRFAISDFSTFSFYFLSFSRFLSASSHFYKRSCPLVGRLVGRSVGNAIV